MGKPIIALDIDDVLLPHFQDLIDWHNETYSTDLTLADNGSEDLKRWGATSRSEAIRRVQQFFKSEAFKSAQPFADAVHALKDLKERYEIIAVTARDTIIEDVTRQWLDEHFADLISAVHFTAKFSLDGKQRQKSAVLQEIKAGYLIDDSLDNILAADAVGVKAILFGEYPWNNHAGLPKGFVRCKDWAAVQEYFDAQAA